MTDLDAIRARHTGKHRCLGAWRAVSGFRMFGLDDGERCDAARLTDEVERLERVRMDVLTTQREIGRDDERARIRAAVEGLPVQSLVGMTGDASVDNYVDRAAVLAAIEGVTT